MNSTSSLLEQLDPVESIFRRMEFWHEMHCRCESPIEILFGVEIHARCKHILDSLEIEMIPQFKWLNWRMDWAFTDSSGPLLFVECDGRQFHSTAAQLDRDERKNRAAASRGIELLRLRGFEIHYNPLECVERTLTHLCRSLR